MSTMVDTVNTASSTSTDATNGPLLRKTNASHTKTPSQAKFVLKKYNHSYAIHRRSHPSPLSQDAATTPSLFGIKNLMALMLIVSNLRLVVENFRKYGVLICFSCMSFDEKDLYLGSILYLSVPAHLFLAYLIETYAASEARYELDKLNNSKNIPTKIAKDKSMRAFQLTWYLVAFCHTINTTANLAISTYMVYTQIDHPLIGGLVELHAIIVWLKVCSYALTNRDLRHALLWPEVNESLPELYSKCPYPQNITLGNLCYFWWAPTLVYQPVYPRTERIRRSFVIKRVAECLGLAIVIWIATAQYAAPLLHNSLAKIDQLDFIAIAERVMKFSTISLFIWLCGFYALFHSFLNALAELLTFADREFYSDWWNVSTVREYWTSWNKPVYHFMRRHIYAPMIGRGLDPSIAQLLVFVFSGVLHELLIGVPTHNVQGKSMFSLPQIITDIN
jgi:diacylglycerol O-acyltransferase-1